MFKTMRVANIDKNRPVAEKKYRAMEKCPSCGIPTEVQLKIIANEYEAIQGEVRLNCSTKVKVGKTTKRCDTKISHVVNTVMPKGK